MKKKPVSFEDRKRIQLEMLIEIDCFCRENGIKYSLAFGTLLGAIRHKGFIPWDDDVDIMMPLPDMIKFKESFQSSTMKYCDIDTEYDFEYGFSRIAQINTERKRGLIASSYGVSIDLYIVVSIPKDTGSQIEFFKMAECLFDKRMRRLKWNKIAIRVLPIVRIPGVHRVVKEYRDYLLNLDYYGKSDIFYIIAGPLSQRAKMIYDFDMFDELVEVEFEGHVFFAIKLYDRFLTMRYGNYMELPPEEERHPYHANAFYWKNY